MGNKILVIPCSGIGKAFGSISREAAYITVEELRSGVADTMCLSLLVMGDEEARQRVQHGTCITVDGCPSSCALKNVELAGGTVAKAFRVVDAYKRHPELKPKEITELDEAGRQLAQFVAEEVAEEVDKIKEVR